MRACALLLVCASLVCCGPSSVYEWTIKPEALPRVPAEGVYVCTPADRTFEKQANAGSGDLTAQALVTALRTRVSRVDRSVAPVTSDQGLLEARAGGYEVMLFPTILHWEERASNWSGKLDKLRLRIDLVDVESGDVTLSTTLAGEGADGEGGSHVENLLPAPLRVFSAAVF